MKKTTTHILTALFIAICLIYSTNLQAQHTILTNFTSPNDSTGINPYGSLVSDGTYLYGMTRNGGLYDKGTIFKILPDGTGYSKLLNFNEANGSHPEGTLLFDGIALYGMTSSGGSSDRGTIFKILPAAVLFLLRNLKKNIPIQMLISYLVMIKEKQQIII